MSTPQEQQGPASFVSNVVRTPAVTATGHNAADGVLATNNFGSGALATRDGGIGIGVSGFSTGVGVQGKSNDGIGVSGESRSAVGVQGISNTSIGVQGYNGNITDIEQISDSSIGVQGLSSSGVGVRGASNHYVGIYGTSSSGIAVVGTSGEDITAGGFHAGVFGYCKDDTGVQGSGGIYGVRGFSEKNYGVRGETVEGYGVCGKSEKGVGVVGTSSSGVAGLFDGNVQVYGNFEVMGNFHKAFVQEHPTDPSREIVYVALEGGEAGTYLRGSGQLESGKAVLALPEHFRLVTATEGLSVQLTPRGEWLQLYVVELNTAQLMVQEAQGKSGTFDYLIQGVRKGFEQHEVIRTKR